MNQLLKSSSDHLFSLLNKKNGPSGLTISKEIDAHSRIEGVRVVAEEPGEATSALPNLTVEKTVKPLKTAENVVTPECNQNGPKQRGGGKRAMRAHGGHTQKVGNSISMKRVVSYGLMYPHLYA
jgi:hypothetical protein